MPMIFPVWVSNDLKEDLSREASASGRSLSQEAQHRLARSLDREGQGPSLPELRAWDERLEDVNRRLETATSRLEVIERRTGAWWWT